MSDYRVKRLRIVERKAERAIQNVVRWTAFDVQRAAKTSIKSGGKTRGLKNWQTSRPGEPPRSHVGTLKQAIRVAQESGAQYVVGAEKLGNGSALKSLEHGGASSIRSTFYADGYVARMKKRPKAPAKNARAVRVRPKAARPYYLYARDNPRGVRVTEYRYFWSREAWDRARKTVSFQEWGRGVRQTTTTSIRLAARPYMAPALAKESTSAKINARFSRALSK